jgi:UDP-N-acetylglucosamine 1-carboxyvinyltransferase
VAAKTGGKTVIKFASANYQVQDLCFYLQQLGVQIKGIGTTTLEIVGRKNINKNVTCYLSEDPIESMLFLAIAATTNSHLTVKRCPIDFLELELLKLEKMGLKFKVGHKYKAKNGKTWLADIVTYSSRLVALAEKIYARPFPGVNIDNLPFFVPIATQAKGRTLIFDWVYENRAIYYTELNRLGAQIELADPHRAYITGPTKLKATEVICPPALRPSTIILVAMLAAKGNSILRNVYSIERGYQDLCRRLAKVGAKIRKID